MTSTPLSARARIRANDEARTTEATPARRACARSASRSTIRPAPRFDGADRLFQNLRQNMDVRGKPHRAAPNRMRDAIPRERLAQSVNPGDLAAVVPLLL